MNSENSEILAPEQELALAYTPRELRSKFRALLEFDHRLARIVSATSEPMLGQMRLAWWREQLSLPSDKRPEGDAVLDGLGEYWTRSENALTAAINAHEVMVAAEQLSPADVERYATGRSEPFVDLLPSLSEAEAIAVGAAARCYICADAATKLSNPAERKLFIAHGNAIADRSSRLPRPLRGLGVLRALAIRSLKRGGHPLMEGRSAALTALGAAMLGR